MHSESKLGLCVCYSTSHFSIICSFHKRYDMLNSQWRSENFSENAPLQSYSAVTLMPYASISLCGKCACALYSTTQWKAHRALPLTLTWSVRSVYLGGSKSQQRSCIDYGTLSTCVADSSRATSVETTSKRTLLAQPINYRYHAWTVCWGFALQCFSLSATVTRSNTTGVFC